MSSEAEEEAVAAAAAAAAVENVCANCGIAGVDNIKLKICDGGCDLVKYCSTNCREEHREQHHDDCKKRVAKLHDKRLFTQPGSCGYGECPICFLPMPLGPKKATFMSCCGQSICCGCIHAHLMSNIHENKASRCVFCRTALEEEEYRKRTDERIEANDPGVLCFMGTECNRAGDYDKALKYWTKAAESGNAEAYYKLGLLYDLGEVVEKNKEKAIYHYEKAAIGGHPLARHNLACCEVENGNIERAVKHFTIAAKLGDDVSMKTLLPLYQQGYITKEEYGATLRTHQAAVEAMKSSQRETAYAFLAKIEQKRKNTSD